MAHTYWSPYREDERLLIRDELVRQGLTEQAANSAITDWFIVQGVASTPRQEPEPKPLPVWLGTCGGCGAYGNLGGVHIRHSEECGEFV
jgi:hypothetical protein